MPLYVVFINRNCEPRGESHLVIGHSGAKPLLACGSDSRDLNWTGNPAPSTRLCRRCEKKQ